jgi:secondary thiamine-phosphate synthase enzyme
MKSYRKELWFNTSTRRAFINITPEKPYNQYRHNTFEDNADAHLKRSVMGRETIIAITNGRLDLGPWEQVFYGEFDGKRRKRVLIKIIGE